ncbi:hypothetical protein HPB48_016291 [Haemaphysalis longicornis]|uniref:Uncharacterized protein n=1 Tax=Haemaphysalis longicornis TaxID=44386 RepID=A0A9J6FT93_HAELO|nr:hypothetical protein HPB48_016291 [Haemaphysalis longicornis]
MADEDSRCDPPSEALEESEPADANNDASPVDDAAPASEDGSGDKPDDAAAPKEPVVVLKAEYNEHSDVTARTDEQIEEFVSKHKLKVEGENVDKPVLKLEEAGLPDDFVAKVKDVLGSSLPALASYALPALLSGRDFIGLGDCSMSEKVMSAMLLASSCRQVRDIYKYFRDTGRSLDLECLEISEETSNDKEDFQSGKSSSSPSPPSFRL